MPAIADAPFDAHFAERLRRKSATVCFLARRNAFKGEIDKPS
jgi:hypothetical protein